MDTNDDAWLSAPTPFYARNVCDGTEAEVIAVTAESVTFRWLPENETWTHAEFLHAFRAETAVEGRIREAFEHWTRCHYFTAEDPMRPNTTRERCLAELRDAVCLALGEE